jgi:hypothetical protein
MSNRHLWANSQTSAMAFHQTLVEDVLAELDWINQLPIKAEFKTEDQFGHGPPFTVGTFQARLPQTNSPADFTLFLFQNGVNDRKDEIKVALLFVVPENAAFQGSAADVDPKALCAQTLRITPRSMGSP